MSKIKLIERMKETLSQLMENEVQSTLSEIPLENLLREAISRLFTAPISPQELELMDQLVLLADLKKKENTVAEIPDYVSIQWICTRLNIMRSTFYKSVHGILLSPVVKVGRRPYFLKSDVIDLFNKTRGMGPHILGKLASKARKNLDDC